MKFINFRVLEFCISLTLGTLCSHWLKLPQQVLFALLLSWILTAFVYYRDRNRFQTSPIFPLLSFLLFFQIGYWNHQLRLPIYKSDAIHKLNDLQTADVWSLKVVEVVKSNESLDKYIVWAQQKGIQSAHGLIYLSISRDSTLNRLCRDDEFLAYGAPKELKDSPNPGQFDFKTYMAHKEVYHSLFLKPSDIYNVQTGRTTLRGYAERLRFFLVEKLKEAPLKQEVRAITQALTLGYRDDIDPELYESYAKAGAVHILAVSGLHVGILMLLLNYLFTMLLEIPKGRILRSVLVILSLWGFALLTGLSPSVVRAVSMFSILSLATWSDRPTHGLNSLFLSYFVLMLITPNWLFQLGFQMSYLAVGSILWLQPKLQKLWQPKFWFIRKTWILFTVGLAAQMGVAPLSIYHFQQFPGLFWLTNWVVLPFLALLLIYALIIVGASAISWGFQPFYKAYDIALSLLNSFIEWTAQQELFLVATTKIPWPWILLTYAVFLFMTLIPMEWKKKVVFTVLYLILMNGIHKTLTKYHFSEELIVFHRVGSSSFILETSKKVFALSDAPRGLGDYPLKNYLRGLNKAVDTLDNLPSVFRLNTNYFVIVDSVGVYPNIIGPKVILRNNAKVHLSRLIKDVKPQCIIVDGSNYYSYVERWRTSCKEQKIPFYYTGDAAFIERIN